MVAIMEAKINSKAAANLFIFFCSVKLTGG
jgi:hypothetical protein